MDLFDYSDTYQLEPGATADRHFAGARRPVWRGRWGAAGALTGLLLALEEMLPLAAHAAVATAHKAAPKHAASAAAEGRVALAIALGGLLAFPVLWSLLAIAVWGLRRLSGRASSTARPPMRWGFWSFVGLDNRVSTSKTVAIVWTYSVASTILSLIVARWLGFPEALKHFEEQGLQAEYALLIGGPIGAAILAKGIVSTGVEAGTTAKPAASSPSAADLVSNDAGETDLGDLQYVLFNIIALAFFWSEFLRVPYEALPTIPEALLGLSSVAAVGYVANKSLASAPMITSVTPTPGIVGATARLVCSGLLREGDDSTLVTVSFGTAKAPPPALSFTATQGALLDVTVPEAAGQVELTVTTPSGKKVVWPGYPIEPKILRPPEGAKAGQPIKVKTTGVVALGPALATLKVTIAGKAAQEAHIEDGELTVTVPSDVRPGAQALVVTTAGGSDERTMVIAP